MAKRKKTSPELVDAICDGDEEMAKRLLAAGHPVDETDREGRTPLMNAIIDNELKFAQLFLKHSANPDHQDANGWTALHFAAQNLSLPAAQILLRAGAQVDLQDSDGNPPLWTAVYNSQGAQGELELIKLLLDHGANPRQKSHGVGVLDLVGESEGIKEIEKCLKAAAGLHSPARRKRTARKVSASGKPSRPPMDDYHWTDVYQLLWDTLVPPQGQARSVQGELIRCMGKLTDEAYRNGNINWDAGHRIMCRFVGRVLDDPSVFKPAERKKIRAAVAEILKTYRMPNLSGHGSAHYYLTEKAVSWCVKHPKPISHKRNLKLKR